MSGKTLQGKLCRAKNGKTWLLVPPSGKELQIPRGAVSTSLWPLDRKAQDGMEVEFELEKGQPRRIRRPGEDWVPPASSEPPANAGRSQPSRGGERQPQPPRGGTAPVQAGGAHAAPAAASREYHNPYNFVPAPPRKGGEQRLGDLGDRRPPGHHRYHPNRWTGRIAVRMRTVTPLLLPDAQRAAPVPGAAAEHRLYPVRTVGGKPYIPPTSVKGMLRAAYEAVTNSRFGVFGSEHRSPLAYRADAQMGIRLVPVRIEKDSEGRLWIQLLPGTSEIDSDGRPLKGRPMYAAWLPRYDANRGGNLPVPCGGSSVSKSAVRYQNGEIPCDGDQVNGWLQRVCHWRWNRTRNDPDKFYYWRVVSLAKDGLSAPKPQIVSDPDPTDRTRPYHQRLNQLHRLTLGYVYITNQNINKKHDERVFFVAENHPQSGLLVHPLTKALEKQWKTLICNYHGAHDDVKEIRGRAKPGGGKAKPWDYLGNNPGDTAWSRHLYKEKAEDLKHGDLCYAEVALNNGGIEVLGLYPVTISRRLFAKSPWDLLPESLRPAESIDKLSPADRVFGWVRDGDEEGAKRAGPAAWRGCLRVGRVTCLSDDPVEEFPGDGLPLAILGQPKPQQFRFYAAANPEGVPLRNQDSQPGYREGQGLRGRKVYPHHAGLPRNYWDNPMEDRTQGPTDNRYQEYRRPRKDEREQRDTQNRSLGGWVKPNVAFDFEIHVENLSDVELGALLWLLTLQDGYHHRLGGGKPLGFGSVHLTIKHTELWNGEDLRESYLSLGPDHAPSSEQQERLRRRLIQAYEQAVEQAYGNGAPFKRVPFIAAFLRAASGFQDGKPVHYPRTAGLRAPDPEGEGYRWFVANKQTAGPKLPLGALPDDQGLPYLPDPDRDRGFERRGNPRYRRD